jgi:hypothetical protein
MTLVFDVSQRLIPLLNRSDSNVVMNSSLLNLWLLVFSLLVKTHARLNSPLLDRLSQFHMEYSTWKIDLLSRHYGIAHSNTPLQPSSYCFSRSYAVPANFSTLSRIPLAHFDDAPVSDVS